MKTIDESSRNKFLFLMILSFLIIVSCYIYHENSTYKSINVVAADTATVEYGSANYDIEKLIKEVDGEIVSIKKDIDTKVVGEQEIIIEVRKNNVIKEIPIKVSVIDTVAPEIKMKKDKVTITKGESFDLLSNVESVIDAVDGEITLLNSSSDSDRKSYYNFSYTDNLESVGNHEIIIYATDSYGNISTASFILEVCEPEPETVEPVFTDLPANLFSKDLVSIAYSLVGMPYKAGSSGAVGFDCSGFVQYVYSQVGINISRSSSTQLHDGVAVSYQDAQPGDILSWGYVDGVATHSALYVGNGQMIHATNPAQGVITSDVAAWTRGSGTRIISVRRIK